MKLILIVGGNGQLGREFVSELNRRGIKFLSPSRTELNILNHDSIKNYFSKNTPKIVINCAAWTNVDLAESCIEETMDLNVKAVVTLANECQLNKIQFFNFSSDYVFDGHESSVNRIDGKRNPMSVYGLSKSLGEDVVSELLPNLGYSIRTAWLYGSFGKNFFKTMQGRAEIGAEATVVDDQTGQPTWTKDLVERVLLIIEFQLPAGTYHVTNSGSASWYEFAKEIYSLSERDPSLVHPIKTSSLGLVAKRPMNSVLDDSFWEQYKLPQLRSWRMALLDFTQ